MPKITKTIDVWHKSNFEGPTPAMEFVQEIIDRLKKVPPEFRENAFLEFGAYEDAWVHMDLRYQQIETDEEYQLRMKHDADLRYNRFQRNEERERQEYERLKAKYEKKPRSTK